MASIVDISPPIVVMIIKMAWAARSGGLHLDGRADVYRIFLEHRPAVDLALRDFERFKKKHTKRVGNTAEQMRVARLRETARLEVCRRNFHSPR